mgnify:CR=1 FL=1
MMNILLSGENGEANAYFKVPGDRTVAGDDLLLYSLEITGTGCYWVEFSRALIKGKPSATTQRMADAYPDAMEIGSQMMRAWRTCVERPPRVLRISLRNMASSLGHLSGHSIGTTMIEYPAIGAKKRGST